MTTTTSNIKSIKKALIYAHDEMMNRHALNKEDFEKLDLADSTLNSWIEYVEELRETTKEYLRLSEDKDATEEQIIGALGKVAAGWRRVCKEGAESDFHKNFFVRKTDAYTIAEWCGRTATITARGRVWAPKGKADFRKHVETLIGIRMAGNAILTDEQRDYITDYEGAIRMIKNKEDALADTVTRGKTTYGLRSVAKFKAKDLEEHEAFFDKYKITGQEREDELKVYRDALATAKKAVADAEADIKKYEKIRDTNKEGYDKTIALLKSIGADK